MNLLFSTLAFALLAFTVWFYEYHYVPLQANLTTLTTQNQALAATDETNKVEINSLNTQLDETKKADALAIAQLTSQLKALQNVPIVASPVVVSPKFFLPPNPTPEQPNWTWSVNGRDYHNVVVNSVDADCVHITYDGGIGSLNQSDLPPDLQKMFNYDSELAAAASKQKEAALAQASAAEVPKIEALKQQEQVQGNSHTTTAKVNASPDAGAMAARQQRIQFLEDDIDEKRRLLGEEHHNSNKMTYGSYSKVIADDTKELASLGVPYYHSP